MALEATISKKGATYKFRKLRHRYLFNSVIVYLLKQRSIVTLTTYY